MKKTNAVRILENASIPLELVSYTYDPEQLKVGKIAKENDLVLAQIFKTLVLESEDGQIVVAVVPGHKRLSIKQLAAHARIKRLALLPSEKLYVKVGYVRGGCSPVGMKHDFPVYIDMEAQGHTKIFVNAGLRGLLMGLSPDHLRDATNASFVEITYPY